MAPWAYDVLRLDGNGNPRTLRLFASLVEAESRRFAAAAISQPAENDLVRAFRGGATPTVPIAEFLDCVQRCNYLFDGAVYVLAAAYLALFMRSPAALEAGIVVEPATVHRLVSVAVLLGAKFSSPRYFERRVESFQICSGQSIRSSELCPLELLFLRALDYRMSIGEEEFRRFFRILERRPAPARSSVTCGATKRKAEEEEEPRRVRACQLAARYGISGFNQSGGCFSVEIQQRKGDEKPELIAEGKESEDEKPVLIADAGDQMFA